jgi:hypothetical protein
MEKTRKYFSHDDLLKAVSDAFEKGLSRLNLPDRMGEKITDRDCLMSGLALFTLKCSSLLQFDTIHTVDPVFRENLQTLFRMDNIPCDTQMRTRLDEIDPRACRPAFSQIFTLLQRAKVLDHFKFMEDYYLISLDGTGVFSSHAVYCNNCCIKEHRDGRKTYYHQVLCAAMVHPDQKVVFPFAPEPIMNNDGDQKNDCERNAAKRWLEDFRREHPHLKAVILADGLSSNAPFINELQKYNLKFILICKENDHSYLSNIVKNADESQSASFTETKKDISCTYRYINDVSLNASNQDCKVNVICFQETKKGKTTKWMWVTNFPVSRNNVTTIVKGARTRWKIENETFNTLKNQGYQFEHNFGHGSRYLTTIFTHLMLLAFFIDQCLERLNKRFQDARTRLRTKRDLWSMMLNYLYHAYIPNFETLYENIARPPPKNKLPSVI